MYENYDKIAIIAFSSISFEDAKLIINTLQSLGGVNRYLSRGDRANAFYFIDSNGYISHSDKCPKGYSSMNLAELKSVLKGTAPIETVSDETTVVKPKREYTKRNLLKNL